jgi:hypothetical protein
MVIIIASQLVIMPPDSATISNTVLALMFLLGRPLAGHRHRFDQYRRFRCTTNALTVHTQLLLLPLRLPLPLPLLHCHLRLSSLLRLQLPLRQHCHQLRLLLVLLRPLPL